jgi:hypothetical protein
MAYFAKYASGGDKLEETWEVRRMIGAGADVPLARHCGLQVAAIGLRRNLLTAMIPKRTKNTSTTSCVCWNGGSDSVGATNTSYVSPRIKRCPNGALCKVCVSDSGPAAFSSAHALAHLPCPG